MNFYKHHLGDYDGHTAHLSWIEDMAYTRLMRVYYRRELPIPADIKDACRLVRAITKQEKVAVQSVLQEFFDLQSDGWHSKRCDEEIKQYQAQASTNRRIAQERTVKRNVERIVDEPSTKHIPNHKPDTKNQYKTRFAEFWAVYPNKKAKGDAEKAWNALKPDDSLAEQILKAVSSSAASEQWTKDSGKFIPYPATWLRAQRWMDDVSTVPASFKYAEGCEGLAL